MSQESQGQDAAGGAAISWVGEQRLMEGYCGRAASGAMTTTPATTTPAAVARAAGETTTSRAGRPIAAVRGRARRREMIMRVAPPRPTPDEPVPLEAA
jgi:hypothetical protein